MNFHILNHGIPTMKKDHNSYIIYKILMLSYSYFLNLLTALEVIMNYRTVTCIVKALFEKI